MVTLPPPKSVASSTSQGQSVGNRNPITGKIEGGTQYNPSGSTVVFSKSGQGTSYAPARTSGRHGGGGSSQPTPVQTPTQQTTQANVQNLQTKDTGFRTPAPLSQSQTNVALQGQSYYTRDIGLITSEQRIKGGVRLVGDRPATEFERSRVAEGKFYKATPEELKSIQGARISPELTRTENTAIAVRNQAEAIERSRAKSIETQTSQPIVVEATTKAQEYFNKVQQQVIEGKVSQEAGQKDYENYVNSLNKDVSNKIETSLLSNPQYLSQANKIAQLESQRGAIEKTPREVLREQIRKAPIEVLKLTPLALPATLAQQSQKQEVINPKNLFSKEYRKPTLGEAVEVGISGGVSLVQAGGMTKAILGNLQKEILTEEALKIASRTAREEAKNVVVKSVYEKVGTIEEKNMVKNILGEALPEPYKPRIETAEIGKFRYTKSVGRGGKGVIIELGSLQEDAGRKLASLIKTTEAGKVKSIRFVTQDLKTGKIVPYRFAYPSEQPLVRIPIQGGPPIEVTGVNRFKGLKVLKSVSKSEFEDITGINSNIKKIDTKAITFEVGGKTKGTRSILELKEGNVPDIFRAKEPKIKSLSLSKRFEILNNKAEDIISRLEANQMVVEQKIGEARKGLSIEKGVSKSFDKSPFLEFEEFKVPKTSGGKPVDFSDMLSAPPKRDLPKVNTESVGSQSLKQVTEQSEKQMADLTQSALETYQQKAKVVNVPKTKYGYATGEIFGGSSAQILRTLNKQQNKLITPFAYSDIFGTAQIQPTLTKQQEQQIQIPKLKIQPFMPPEYKMPESPRIPMGELLPFADFPNMDRGSGNQRQAKKLRTKVNPFVGKYTASLGQAFFGKPVKVSSKQYAKLNEATYTGIEARPVLYLSDDEKKVKKMLSKVKF